MKPLTLEVTTPQRVAFVDITRDVEARIREAGFQEGVAVLFVPHTTCGLTLNEHADPDVVEDIQAQLARLVPREGAYRHLEGNADSHIKTSLVGSSATVLVEGGRLLLGTWQGVFLCEFDGPRRRTVWIKLIPG